jgi:hypothetical protein
MNRIEEEVGMVVLVGGESYGVINKVFDNKVEIEYERSGTWLNTVYNRGSGIYEILTRDGIPITTQRGFWGYWKLPK